jgi:hypothetical protein
MIVYGMYCRRSDLTISYRDEAYYLLQTSSTRFFRLPRPFRLILQFYHFFF